MNRSVGTYVSIWSLGIRTALKLTKQTNMRKYMCAVHKNIGIARCIRIQTSKQRVAPNSYPTNFQNFFVVDQKVRHNLHILYEKFRRFTLFRINK